MLRLDNGWETKATSLSVHLAAQRESVDRFVRRENVARFGAMLATERDEAERKILAALMAEEQEKQRCAGDSCTVVIPPSIFW